MERQVTGFHQDAERRWVAELECGHNQEDFRRALAVLEEVVVLVELTAQQRAMLERIRAVLGEAPARPRLAAVNGAAPEPAGAT